MNRFVNLAILIFFFLPLSACGEKGGKYSKESIYSDFHGIAKIASGWRGEIVAKTNQSYVGFDVEIGDADNDGKNEILMSGSPNSNLYLFKNVNNIWRARILMENLARCYPCLGLGVKVVDLNGDGINEILAGTGSESRSANMQRRAIFYVFQTDGRKITKSLSSQPDINMSRFAHGIATYDIDADGILEVISAYCAWGEIIRYDVDKDLTSINARIIAKSPSAGEGSLIADVDNDGKMEYLLASGFKTNKDAFVKIFEFDSKGELVFPPRLSIVGGNGKKNYDASIEVGDVDNDGKNELIIAWKNDQDVAKGTILGYKVGEIATPVYTFAYEDEGLDIGLFENAMVIADADNDGRNELIISTLANTTSWWHTESKGLGHVLMFKVAKSGKIDKQLILDFHKESAESSWLAVGDADNDGKNEIVLATGKGKRRELGNSYVVLLEKELID